MFGGLGIDFGTSNTVVAIWDEGRRKSHLLTLPGYERKYQQSSGDISVIPSLIHYRGDHEPWVGNEVLQYNRLSSSDTRRWMKRYISIGNPLQQHYEAGKDFLLRVIQRAAETINLKEMDIALTVPVNCFEYYTDWLFKVAEVAGLPAIRLLDEPSAAAIGYEAQVEPDQVYLVFDFGGGTLDIAIVRLDIDEQTDKGLRCRTLGKSSVDYLGGAAIDRWLFQEALRQNGRAETDDEIRLVSNELLTECEQAKERLSFHTQAEVGILDPNTGAALLSATFTQDQFQKLLSQKGVFARINVAIGQALKESIARGYTEDKIQTVLMVGGSSQIPVVQERLCDRFGTERVKLHRPLDAVALGAARYAAGVALVDYIQHDYAIRVVNAQGTGYEYHPIVRRGTTYPSQRPLLERYLIATFDDGQRTFGLAIFEIGNRSPSNDGQSIELIFTPNGPPTILTSAQEDQPLRFWVNKDNPTYLIADPPAQKGEVRFKVEFNLDSNKRLLITAYDLKIDRVYRDIPVIRLR